MKINAFCNIDKEDIYNKYLSVNKYQTQRHKNYFDKELIYSLARLRGAYSGMYKYAEAYYIYKLV